MAAKQLTVDAMWWNLRVGAAACIACAAIVVAAAAILRMNLTEWETIAAFTLLQRRRTAESQGFGGALPQDQNAQLQ